ncbi:MAG TPA: methyltransferase domain-containing protein [Dehalococcoidia bacterium]|jgi:SAM-dependent methyltransferase|nr:methyltransferase domain-containing protein [Dehalococcoidia bacterium]
MPYGTKAQLLRVGNRPRLRYVRSAFAQMIGEVEPHSHVRWAAIRTLLAAVRKRQRAATVLEVGAGSGEMTLEIAGALEPARLYTFDITPPRPPSRLVADCFTGDATALPLRDATQDVVTLFDIIEHIPDDAAALAETYRVLRPGGVVLVTVPTPHYPVWFGRTFHESIGHVRDGYTDDSLSQALKHAGFRRILVRHHTSLPFLLFAWPYYRYARHNVYASAVATALVKPLVAIDRHLPGRTWGALIAYAVKPASTARGA